MAKKPISGGKRLNKKRVKKSSAAPEGAAHPASTFNPRVLEGAGGYTQRPSAADKLLTAQGVINLELALRARTHLENHVGIMQVELFSGVGVTSYEAPIILMRGVLDPVTKALAAAHLDGVVHVAERVLFGHPAYSSGPAILTSARVLVFASPGLKVEQVRAAMIGPNGTMLMAMPTGRVREVKGDDLTAAANWLMQPPSASRLTLNDKGKQVVETTSEGITPLMRSRLLEIASQRDPATNLVGVGQGVGVVRGIRTKLAEWHKGRPDAGTVIGANFDPWLFWFTFRQAEPGNLLAPVRWDILPKAGAPAARRSRKKHGVLPPKATQKKLVGKRLKSRKQKPDEPSDES